MPRSVYGNFVLIVILNTLLAGLVLMSDTWAVITNM